MDRTDYIGSSDAADLLAGRFMKVYRKKVGLDPEEDLSRKFCVQFGKFSEPFHREWTIATLAEEGVVDLSGVEGEAFHQHPTLRYIGSTTDARLFTADLECIPVEMKLTGGHMGMAEMIETYMPQMQHHMLVTCTKRLLFSVVFGTDEPVRAWVSASAEWHDHMMAVYEKFWQSVMLRQPPLGPTPFPDLPATPSTDLVKINGMTRRDATGDNLFTSLAAEYLANEEAAATYEKAKKGLKELVRADEREVYLPGVITITRDARGALRFKKLGAAAVAA